MTRQEWFEECTDDIHPDQERVSGPITLCAILVAITFTLDLILPWGTIVSPLYAGVGLVSLRSQQRQFILLVASVSAFFTILGGLLSLPHSILWITIVNRTLVLGVIWGIVLLTLHQSTPTAQCHQMVHARVASPASGKVLRGFLPICASCKVVRDAHGHWQPIEVYISEHAEVQFSHSICPDCTAKLYPQ